MKAYIGVDQATQFFLWEESVAREINPTLGMLEIPDELLSRYMKTMTEYTLLQAELRKLIHT